MGRGAPARSVDRGGEIVPALSGAGARLIAAGGSLAAAAGLAVYAAIAADRLGFVVLGIGAGACLALALSLAARRAGPVALALALLGTEYAVYLSLSRPGLAVGSVYAGGFLLAAELAYRALDPVAVRDEPSLVVRRLADALATAVGAGALGALILTFSNVEVARGLGLEALGVLAAVLTLLAVAWLAHARRG